MPLFIEFKRESRSLLRLALPIMLSQIAQVLAGFLDAVMAGRAGASEQAVVALGVALWIPVFVTLMNVVQAVSPIVAEHVGADDRTAVVRDTHEGVMLAVGIGFVPLLILPWTAGLLRWAGVEPALAGRVGVFLWGICLGFPAAMVYRALAFYSASINQTRPVMVISLIGLGVNATLNWVLIYGHWGAPAMGGAGCGWATGVGMWFALFALVAWTRHAPAYRPYYLWRTWQHPHWNAQKRLLRIGLPMGGAGFAEVAAFAGVAVLVARFGDVQIAAHQIGLNFSALTFMLPMGVSAAVTIRVGQAIGAGQARHARFVAYSGLATGMLIALMVIGPMVVLRHLVAAAYSSDPAVQDVAAKLLLFAAFWQLFDAAQVCAVGALRGYQVTLAPMLLMLGAFWVVGIPVGSWLGYHGFEGGAPMGVYGFWIGLVVGLVLVAVGLVILLRRVAFAPLGLENEPQPRPLRRAEKLGEVLVPRSKK